jgi:hypothetical protein
MALPLQAAVGSETLIAAVAILRDLDAGAREMVEPDDPHGFVPAAWRPFLIEQGKVDAILSRKARGAAGRSSRP